MSKFDTVAAEIGALVTEKNLAYGDSFAKCGDFLRLLWPNGIGPEQYGDALAMVRIFDKQMRIATAKHALGESPYRDIAGYGILGAVKDAAAHKAPSLCDSEVVKEPYTFPPALKFIGALPSDYMSKIREELNEAATAKEPKDVIVELFDVIHAAETAVRSLSKDWNVDADDMRDHCEAKNRARGYYER